MLAVHDGHDRHVVQLMHGMLLELPEQTMGVISTLQSRHLVHADRFWWDHRLHTLWMTYEHIIFMLHRQ